MTNTANEQTRTEQGPLRRLLSKLSLGDGATRTMEATWNGAVIAESDDTVVVEGNRNAAWYYPQPSPAAHKVTDRVAFSGGVRVRRAE